MEGEQPQLGDLLTMVINRLLNGMILQVGCMENVWRFWLVGIPEISRKKCDNKNPGDWNRGVAQKMNLAAKSTGFPVFRQAPIWGGGGASENRPTCPNIQRLQPIPSSRFKFDYGLNTFFIFLRGWFYFMKSSYILNSVSQTWWEIAKVYRLFRDSAIQVPRPSVIETSGQIFWNLNPPLFVSGFLTVFWMLKWHPCNWTFENPSWLNDVMEKLRYDMLHLCIRAVTDLG